MKILLSYAAEYDKGEGTHWARVLEALGHEIHRINVAASHSGLDAHGSTVRGYPPEVTICELIAEHPGAALFLYIEPLALIPRGMEASPIPTACIISDVHRKLKPRLNIARLFDHVFLYHRNYVGEFERGVRGTARWLPVACDTELFSDSSASRDLDVAFIGQLFGPGSERRRVMERLAAKYRVNEQRYYRQSEIPEVYGRAKIVLNLPAADDLNIRFFEALSSGALLISRRSKNGQEELFKEGVHFAGFDSERELFDKVDHYLRHEDERARIARAGCDEVRLRHTLKHRADMLLDATAKKASASIRTMGPDAVLDVYAAMYEENGRIEALLRMAAERRENPGTRARLLMRAAGSFARRALNGW